MNSTILTVLLLIVANASGGEAAARPSEAAAPDDVAGGICWDELDGRVYEDHPARVCPAAQISHSSVAEAIQLVNNLAELQVCLKACKTGGATMTTYRGTMPTPQLKAIFYAAAAAGTVSCMGFCYARLVD